jgi:hypothetical protein
VRRTTSAAALSINAKDYLARLDDRDHVRSLFQLQIFERRKRDKGRDHIAPADIDPDACCQLAFVDPNDLALE